jgi:hypothetical protein
MSATTIIFLSLLPFILLFLGLILLPNETRRRRAQASPVAMIVNFNTPDAIDPEALVWHEGEMPISVKHRDGWCALPEGHVFSEGDTFAPTLCEVTTGKGVNLPGGVERREPDCSDCLLTLGWPQGLTAARPGTRSRPSGLSERLVTQ